MKIISFPRSAWECSLDALRRVMAQDAERPESAFPRGAWERDNEINLLSSGTQQELLRFAPQLRWRSWRNNSYCAPVEIVQV